MPVPLAGAGSGALVRLPPDEARHAMRTLRLKEGAVLELCDGAGGVARGELLTADAPGGEGALARLLAPAAAAPPPAWDWTLAVACGSLKGGRSDWLVEKASELGAGALLPLLTERSPALGGAEAGAKDARRAARVGRGNDADGGGREARWRRVAQAAMKQSLRARCLALEAPARVPELAARVRAARAAFVGVAGAPPLAAEAAALAGGPGGAALIIIGPEGDFAPEELALLVAAGATPVGLGGLRLRAETAAVAALAFLRLALPEADER